MSTSQIVCETRLCAIRAPTKSVLFRMIWPGPNLPSRSPSSFVLGVLLEGGLVGARGHRDPRDELLVHGRADRLQGELAVQAGQEWLAFPRWRFPLPARVPGHG